MMLLVAGMAAAQEDPVHERTIYGDRPVERARDQVIAQADSLGWELVRERSDGTLVFKGDFWTGKARFERDGNWSFTHPILAVKFESPTKGAFMFWEPKKIEAAQRKLYHGVHPDLLVYQEALALEELRSWLLVLPERLDALWERGVPLEQPGPYPDPASRREAVLDYWATRLPNEAGAAVCEVVEGWVAEVLQNSSHPASSDELEAATRRRTDQRTLGG